MCKPGLSGWFQIHRVLQISGQPCKCPYHLLAHKEKLIRFSRRKSILPFIHSHSNTYALSNDQKFPEHIDLNWRESGKSIKEKFRSLKFFGKGKLFKQDIHHLFACHIMPLQEFPE